MDNKLEPAPYFIYIIEALPPPTPRGLSAGSSENKLNIIYDFLPLSLFFFVLFRSLSKSGNSG